MADQFNTYDKNPIVGQTFTFRSWRFGVREVLLAFVTVLLLVICFILAGLLGKSSQQLQEARVDALTSAIGCRDTPCLKTAAHAFQFLNTSVDPCDDFFQFACGGYSVVNPLDYNTISDNIYGQMRDVNEDRLVDILESPSERFMTWSAERKLKDFYSSCTDDFAREQAKATPLLTKVMPLLGGWYVLDTWNSAGWDLNSVLKTVQSDLWVRALWRATVNVNQYDQKTRIIAINPTQGKRYMQRRFYSDPSKEKIRTDYKQFMRTVAILIARDAGVTSDQSLTDRIEVFVGDAYDIEARLAKLATSSNYQRDPYNDAKQVALDVLTRNTGNVIDWTAQLTYLFNAAGVTGSTKVVLPYPGYLYNLTSLINSLDPDNRNRILHNYLTWCVLEMYVQDLSWEYVHANRQLYVDLYGRPTFLGSQRYCFRLATLYMDIALGALYVNEFFDEKNKDKVTEITESVKQAIEDMIKSNTWMDENTKQYATDKMYASTYKIGYPDFMRDEEKLDSIYADLTVNASDFFGNLLSANQQIKREWNRELREGEDRSEWLFRTYETNLGVLWYWDEIIVPAGILQFPLYSYDMPHYYSFGAIGTLVGHFVHHLVDEMGRRWDNGGIYINQQNGWWSNDTINNYNAVRQCVVDLYNNVTQGPYVMYNGEQRTVAVNGKTYAGEAIAITTGIRIAYNAFKNWQQAKGQDPAPPGQFTPDQMFFLGNAQTYCYNRDPRYDFVMVSSGRANEATQVNVALSELPEFSAAFNCKAPSKMSPSKRCTYY